MKAVTSPGHRVTSIDLLRGIIMVIMALDHARDFFHVDAMLFDPTNLDKTHPALFITRWVTHFCAPAFVLLAGTSIAISSARKSPKELSKFLVTRGLWLVLLDVIVLRFIFFFNFYYDLTFLSVLWMIGLCMVCMAAIIYLSQRWIVIIGLMILFLHDAAGMIPVSANHWFFAPWTIFMRAGFLSITPEHAVISVYPIIPWLGLMMLGYGLGSLYDQKFTSERRKKWLMILGISSIAIFLILRFVNLYGDPSPWSVQKNVWFTVLSFINVTKYPVSLQFILLTVGPLMIALSILERNITKLSEAFLTIGRVPLFYFLLHFLIIHSASLILFMWRTGKSFPEIDTHFNKSFGGIVAGSGYSLVAVYVTWFAVVAIMYPLCKFYDQYKSTHHQKWLSYF